MAKSHLSYTPPIPLHNSQFKHLTASGKMQFKLFSLRHLSNAVLTDSLKNTLKTHITLVEKQGVKRKTFRTPCEPICLKPSRDAVLLPSVVGDQHLAYSEIYSRAKAYLTTLFTVQMSDFTN